MKIRCFLLGFVAFAFLAQCDTCEGKAFRCPFLQKCHEAGDKKSAQNLIKLVRARSQAY